MTREKFDKKIFEDAACTPFSPTAKKNMNTYNDFQFFPHYSDTDDSHLYILKLIFFQSNERITRIKRNW